MPPEIFVIMGRVGIGKSSTIRALTGLFHGGKTDVQTVQGTLKNIYVEIRSLQEKGILPSKFISDHNNDTYILLSLRIDSFKGYPNGLTYLQAFINNNWQVKEITILGNSPLPYSLPPGIPTPLHIPTSTQARIPANQIAHQIRNVWNWL